MELKDKIRSLRKAQGLTLEDVAKIVGVGKSTVRKWETGYIENMRRDKIAKLAEALHTTPAYLMGWEDEQKSEPQAPALVNDDPELTELLDGDLLPGIDILLAVGFLYESHKCFPVGRIAQNEVFICVVIVIRD